jgi:hypothetical protein
VKYKIGSHDFDHFCITLFLFLFCAGGGLKAKLSRTTSHPRVRDLKKHVRTIATSLIVTVSRA